MGTKRAATRTSAGWWLGVLGVLGALGCGPRPAPPPPPPPAAPLTVAACAALLRERHGIDVSPEPRICLPLHEALAPLGAASLAEVHGLIIVRDARGPCADRCPDLARALLSDGALAFYRVGAHELHVVDATFDGPRWRGGEPSAEALAAYLAALGLADWDALVARVRTIPGATLPATVPIGSPLVFDAIVRHGPAYLLGGEVALPHLLRHELGHAVLLRRQLESIGVRAWSSITGWTEPGGELGDGYVGGVYGGEQAIVASRLVLGLPRGAATNYLPAAAGHPTRYAAFDPMEDHAESFRLVHADPVALGTASPARLLVSAAGEIDLRDPALRRFIRPGVAALLAPTADPQLAMATLRAHGAALLPEAADLADARPLPVPATVQAPERAELAAAALVVTIGRHRFRPPDAAIAALLARWQAERLDMEDFQRVIDEMP